MNSVKVVIFLINTQGYYSERDRQNLKMLCDEFLKYNHIDKAAYEKYDVKRGLRNADSTGVLAGLTKICNVHGYIINEREKTLYFSAGMGKLQKSWKRLFRKQLIHMVILII